MAVTAFLAAGCGPNYKDRAVVSGKVSLGAANLTAGTVTFTNDDNITGAASINADGTYKMTDAPLGDVTITIAVPKPPPRGRPPAWMKDRPVMKPPPGSEQMASDPEAVARRIVQIPDKYKDASTSGLTYTVEDREQTFDIKLTP